MAIRVKLAITMEGKKVISSALVNSGFEGSGPDLVIPISLAKKAGLWPTTEADIEEAETAGGIAEIYILKGQAKVKLMTNDEVKEEAPCNIIINPYVSEVLISDCLIDDLGIIAISFKEGIWRHRTDPPGARRKTEKPQHWK